eukprot:Skav228658  [mRNA]  locus=scaffold2369:179694:197246:+ [translate_table: standard]
MERVGRGWMRMERYGPAQAPFQIDASGEDDYPVRQLEVTCPVIASDIEDHSSRYHIAERTLELMLAMYRVPKEVVDELSSLALRHVGMSIPVEFFPPFVQAAVEAVQDVTGDETVITAFRWSITLIGKILSRTVNEGRDVSSTLVMRAITLDNALAVRKAVSVTARGERASQLLNEPWQVTVGTHSISPLVWAIENNSLVAADAIIKAKLLGSPRFARHPDIIHLLINRARPLVPTLLDGLIWRSRFAVQGLRRVNYYVKHLIEDSEGNFNQALKWATSQSFLQHTNKGNPEAAVRTVIFASRVIIYLGNIPVLLTHHVRKIRASYREGKMERALWLRYPVYLQKASELYKMGLLICLICMHSFCHTQEFNEGDVGIAGGIQVLESAVDHPTAAETIKRCLG